MADPTSVLTFQDMQIRVAEYLGVADYSGGAAAVPTDAHDLALVKRLVNDGYRRFLRETRWNFMAVPLTLVFKTGVVASDNARYYLPDDFGGQLLDPFTYGSSGPVVEILQVPEETIRRYVAGQGSTTGTPVNVAVRPINVTATTTAQRWEAVFWPTPSGTETVTARYRRWPAALSANGDRSVAGFVHDEAVLGAALAAAELDRNDSIGVRESAYQNRLMASKRLDAQAGPSRLPDYGGRGDRTVRRFSYDSYNGTTLDAP